MTAELVWNTPDEAMAWAVEWVERAPCTEFEQNALRGLFSFVNHCTQCNDRAPLNYILANVDFDSVLDENLGIISALLRSTNSYQSVLPAWAGCLDRAHLRLKDSDDKLRGLSASPSNPSLGLMKLMRVHPAIINDILAL